MLFVRPLLTSMFSDRNLIQEWINDFAKLYENSSDYITLFDFDIIERIDANTKETKFYPRVSVTDHGVLSHYVLDENLFNNKR